MYDGSKEKLKVNVSKTNKISKLTKKNNSLLEAEIGPIHGSEDGFKSSKKKLKKDELINFIKNANFDLLAIGAGNTHGLYSKINISSSLKKNMNKLYLGFSKKNKVFDMIEFNKYSENNLIKFFCYYMKRYS